MKYRLLTASLAAAALLAGCSAPTATTPASTVPSAHPSTSAAPQASPTTAQADASGASLDSATPGQEVDKDALAARMAEGVKTVKSMHMESVTTGQVGGNPVDVTLRGDVDTSDPDSTRGSLTMSGAIEMEAVVDGADYYLKLPMLGPDWFKASADDLGQAGSGVPNPADQTRQQREVAAAASKAVYNGEETIDGVATKHYTLTVPRDKAFSGQNATASPGKATEIPVEVYLDAQGVLRRMIVVVDEPAVTVTTDMSRFNEPVTITVPTDAKPLPGR